jgi:hypothetical protein
MSLMRPLPSGSKWGFALGILALVGCIVAAGWFSSPLPLLLIVGIIAIGEWRGERCPQCRRKLLARKVPVEGGPSYRVFYECRHCERMWDPDLHFDPRDSLG